MSVLTDLRATRQSLHESLTALSGKAAAENRSFTEYEDEVWQRDFAKLGELDARIAQVAGQEQRSGEQDAAFDRLTGRPITGPRGLSAADADVEKAFRCAIKARYAEPIEIPVSTRTHYSPGLEQRDLLKTTATQALPVSVYDRVVQHMVENSAVLRAGATLLNTPTGENLQVPKSTAFSTAALIAEGATITESDPTLAVVTLGAYKYAAYFECSHELASDGNPDLLGFFARQSGQALALAYGDHLINGTGSGQPRGVLLDATAGVTGVTGTGTSLGVQGTAGLGTDILYGLYGSLAEPYVLAGSTAWLMRNASLTVARKLKDTTGQPVLPLQGSPANDLLGSPAYVDPFLPAMANTAKSIVFGAFDRYFVRIAEGLRWERDESFRFQNDLTAFRAIIRLDGALVDVNAIKYFSNAT